MTKPTKRLVHPAKTQISRVLAVRMMQAWTVSYPLSAQRRLIRLGRYPGWSEYSLGAQFILLVSSCGGSCYHSCPKRGASLCFKTTVLMLAMLSWPWFDENFNDFYFYFSAECCLWILCKWKHKLLGTWSDLLRCRFKNQCEMKFREISQIFQCEHKKIA